MSYKQMERRLVDLEQAAAAKQRAWIESLSDAELDALLEEQRPGFTLVCDALSEAEWDRVCDGTMSEAEWQQVQQQAQKRINAAT